jgi:hypothetical protein
MFPAQRGCVIAVSASWQPVLLRAERVWQPAVRLERERLQVAAR